MKVIYDIDVMCNYKLLFLCVNSENINYYELNFNCKILLNFLLFRKC